MTASAASSRTGLLEQIDGEWRHLLETAGRFSESALTRPDAVGHWSALDVLVHTAVWNDELITILESFLARGEEVDFGDDAAVDRLNDEQVEGMLGLSVSQVLDELDQSYRRMVTYLEALPEPSFAPDTYTRLQIVTESLDHYRDHAQDLERARSADASGA